METNVFKSCELPLRLENWVPTPLPIAYLGPKGQVVRLPFLDLQKKQYVMGVAVREVCYRKAVCSDVHDIGFIGVCSMLERLRNRFYPREHSLVSRIWASESVYARDFAIPTLDQLQTAYVLRSEFDATLQILCDNGIGADLWGDGTFICRNCNDNKRFDRVIDFGEKIVREYDPYDEAQKARAMVTITDRDPLYPVEDGVFNWELWEKCESVYTL